MTARQTLKAVLAAGSLCLIALVLSTVAVSANGPFCAERGALVERLGSKYQEKRHGLGITSADQGALEFFASDEGSWTIIVTTTAGKTCILATGHSWHATPASLMGPPA
ncbi:MAG: hypothetical protein AAF441_14830 [Pseudomonadota bacterium]